MEKESSGKLRLKKIAKVYRRKRTPIDRTINIDRLIEEVRCRPTLWDRKDRNETYEDYNADCMWSEIGQKLGTSKDSAKKKWKSLRDIYRKEIKKRKSVKKTNSKIHSLEWQYYSALAFLKDQFVFTRNSFMIPIIESDEDDKPLRRSYNVEVNIRDIKDDPLEVSDTPIVKPTLNELLKRFQKDLIDLERLKLDSRNLARQDDDMMFFRSLLPYFKTLNVDRKFILRTKIQQIVCDYAFNNSNSCTW